MYKKLHMGEIADPFNELQMEGLDDAKEILSELNLC